MRTDHASLTWLKNFKEAEGMLARWLSVLDTFDYEIQFRKGSCHVNADTLSRIPAKRRGKCKFEECSDCRSKDEGAVYVCPLASSRETGDNSNWLDSWGLDQIRAWQEDDPDISKIAELKQNSNEKPKFSELNACSSDVKTLYKMWDVLVLKDNGVLYRECEKDAVGNAVSQIVAPKCIQKEIMHQLHNTRYSGHMGRDKTLSSVRKRFYWPGVTNDVKRWCQSCDQCARRKPGPGRGKSPLQQSSVSRPLERMAVDILGGLPVTRNGNEYIIVVGDYYTKWKEAYAVPRSLCNDCS